ATLSRCRRSPGTSSAPTPMRRSASCAWSTRSATGRSCRGRTISPPSVAFPASPTSSEPATKPMADRFAGVPAEPLAPHDGAPRLQRAGDLCRVTLDRPAEHNRLDPADVDALLALFERLAHDGSVRALVVTGAGDRTFSSGYTLQAIVEEPDARFAGMLDALETLPFPTVAALNGSVY